MSGEVGEKSNLLEIGGLKNGKILPFGALRGPPFRVPKNLRPPGQKNEGPSAGPFETPASFLGPKGALAPLKIEDFVP